MHHDSESICSSVTALGLLKKKREINKRRGQLNAVKGCSKCRSPCTARLDDLNRDIL